MGKVGSPLRGDRDRAAGYQTGFTTESTEIAEKERMKREWLLPSFLIAGETEGVLRELPDFGHDVAQGRGIEPVFPEKGAPLLLLPGIFRKFIAQAQRRFRRDRRTAPAEGRRDGLAEQRRRDLTFVGEGPQIEVILQAGVGHAEMDDGFQLLGRHGGPGNQAQSGGGQIVQHDGKRGFFHPRGDGIAITEIQQHRAPRRPEGADQFRTQAAVAGVLPDFLDADGVGIEPHAVRGLHAAGRAQVAGQGFGVFWT